MDKNTNVGYMLAAILVAVGIVFLALLGISFLRGQVAMRRATMALAGIPPPKPSWFERLLGAKDSAGGDTVPSKNPYADFVMPNIRSDLLGSYPSGTNIVVKLDWCGQGGVHPAFVVMTNILSVGYRVRVNPGRVVTGMFKLRDGTLETSPDFEPLGQADIGALPPGKYDLEIFYRTNWHDERGTSHTESSNSFGFEVVDPK